jgi:trehalose synthase
MIDKIRLTTVDDYINLVGEDTVQRIKRKAEPLTDLHIVNVNSTYYGGGVAELLSSFILLLNSIGIQTGWRVLQGSPDFFNITKKIHNALQGKDINLTERKKKIYESVVFENAVRNHIKHDLVIIHDPQPLPIIEHYRKRGPWLWRCHVDLSSPNPELWDYLKDFVEKYDAVILSMEEYKQDIKTPQVIIEPAIDPFTIKNSHFTEKEIDERLNHYNIPTDLPLVVQISRFDKWKDPEGVIEAFKMARKEVDCTLVLLGNVATDDPEGTQVYESLMKERDDRIIMLSHQDSALVNALQSRAAVVVQKSLREGFGLTVTEAMWKGTPVIGGNVGGIKHQIKDGENGFLVSSIEQAAEKIVQVVSDTDLRNRLGEKARESVKKKYLLIHYLEKYLDLISSFTTNYTLKNH